MTPKSIIPTPFGKFVRTLRIEHNEYMKDMAKRLDVSTAYLSAVETGRRNAPFEWVEPLQREYELSKGKVAELNQAISDSRTYENLNVVHLSGDNRRLIRNLSGKLQNLSEERRVILENWLRDTPK